MKRIDVQNKDAKELQALLAELRGKLTQLTFDLGDKKLKDVSQIKKVKRDIARVFTCLASRQADLHR